MITAPQPDPRRRIRTRARSIVTIAAVILLALLMVVNTRFLSRDEAAAVNPTEFDAAAFAADELPGITEYVQENANEISVIVTAVAADPVAAGTQFGNAAGTDKYAIPVTATGTVSTSDANFLTISVPGLPAEVTVRVPVAQAFNGTALRDVTGELSFADFPGQTDYQQVANDLKTLAIGTVFADVDVAALPGTTITVVGVYVTDSGPAGSFLVTPVSIEGA